jgi:hypothetical protein
MLTLLAIKNSILFVVITCGIKARPRAISKGIPFYGKTKEGLSFISQEMYEKQMM